MNDHELGEMFNVIHGLIMITGDSWTEEEIVDTSKHEMMP
jgi:hypothetical protein